MLCGEEPGRLRTVYPAVAGPVDSIFYLDLLL
jgi:hypothetical protein